MGAFADDPELKKLHAERLEELKEAQEKRKDVSELRNQGHGQLKEIEESEFLPITTQTPSVVCHFFHPEFQRCVILDRHLEILAQKYVQTRFVKLNATVNTNLKNPHFLFDAESAVFCRKAQNSYFALSGVLYQRCSNGTYRRIRSFRS